MSTEKDAPGPKLICLENFATEAGDTVVKDELTIQNF